LKIHKGQSKQKMGQYKKNDTCWKLLKSLIGVIFFEN